MDFQVRHRVMGLNLNASRFETQALSWIFFQGAGIHPGNSLIPIYPNPDIGAVSNDGHGEWFKISADQPSRLDPVVNGACCPFCWFSRVVLIATAVNLCFISIGEITRDCPEE